MNFAGALTALERGHKVKRHHWTGYWFINARTDGKSDIFMHTYDGKEFNLTDTDDIFYTLSNCACDDWEIIEDWDKKTTQPDYMNGNAVKAGGPHWIDNADSWICSNCGYESNYLKATCPHCGAYMTNIVKATREEEK